jgi:cell division protein FtsL
VGTLLGGIVLIFVIAFFSLTQAIRVSTSNYEVDRLTVERERLQARERELQSDLNRLGSEPAIRKLAFDAGLGQLDAPIVLPAR